MNSRKILLLVLVNATQLCAQNWSVFNPSYRYNYKFNTTALISQVVFADSSKVQGNDTTYYLNRVGVECKGSCPGITVSLNPTVTVVVPNMPQFLQRSIVKYANGTVFLRDTAKFVIKPQCTVNQSWLFDSVNNVYATCVGKVLQQNFGVADSVKQILIGTADTLKLSKNFGIIQFPQLYLKGKNYRLVGVELASRYDSTALFGEKVPNAWDFYNFEPGDKFCTTSYYYYKYSWGCTQQNLIIHKKQIVSNGYNYEATNIGSTTCYAPITDGSPNKYSDYNTNSYSPQNLSSKLLENTMYPGQILAMGFYGPSASGPFFNLVKFGLDNKGTFYKYTGRNCLESSNLGGPFDTTNTYEALSRVGAPTGTSTLYYSTRYPLQGTSDLLTATYGVGLGEVSKGRRLGFTPYDANNSCLTCAIKKGQLYFGTETFVGLAERGSATASLRLYPNPCQNLVSIDLPTASDYEIKISNLLGQEVKQQIFENANHAEISTATLPSGVYSVTLYEKGRLMAQQKLFRE